MGKRISDKQLEFFITQLNDKNFVTDYVSLVRLMARELIALREVAKAAKEYKTYLPNMEVIGAAKFSNQLRTAMALRSALEKYEKLREGE